MTLEIYRVIDEIADMLAEKGVKLAEEYKRRDPQEPGRAIKERDEDRLMALMKRRFAAQKRQTKAALETILPPTKVITAPGPAEWISSFPAAALIDEKTERLILQFLIGAAGRGVGVFQEQAAFDVDWTEINTTAAAWARVYSTQFLKGLDNTTMKALREALEAFATQPGFSIGDIMSVLPFGETRARQIAITEVTRVYGQAVQIAGQQLKEQFPDVRVVKRWWTNNDDRVCPICSPLHGDIVEVDDGFGVEAGEAGLLNPPAHPGCRCWISTTTEL